MNKKFSIITYRDGTMQVAREFIRMHTHTHTHTNTHTRTYTHTHMHAHTHQLYHEQLYKD